MKTIAEKINFFKWFVNKTKPFLAIYWMKIIKNSNIFTCVVREKINTKFYRAMTKPESAKPPCALVGAGFSSFQTNPNDEQDNSSRRGDASSQKTRQSYSESESSSWESDDEYAKEKREKHKKRKKKKKKKNRKMKRKRKSSRSGGSDDLSSDNEEIRGNKVISNTKPKTIWLHETNLDHTNAFRKDTVPDLYNLEYGCLYRNDIAEFRVLFDCPCLGLNKKQKVSLYPNKKKSKKRKSISSSLRYFMDRHDGNDIPDVESNEFIHMVESDDFLPVVSNKTKRPDKISTEIGKEIEISCLKKNRYFSQKLVENPADIGTWLEYVAYQDEMVFSEDCETMARSMKSIIEKKVSILEKGLIKNPMSIELILKYMHFINQVLPYDKVKAKWKEILYGIPNRSILWRHYILFLKSDVLNMTVSSVLVAYKSAFRVLIGIHNGTVLSHPAEFNAEEELFVCFLQMVLFLWQAGHTEKAVCFLQCMVELNHFCPQNIAREDHQTKLKEYESFFDSQVPRFGCHGACGWNGSINPDTTPQVNVVASSYATCSVDDFDKTLEENKSKLTKNGLWLLLESLRHTNEFFPYTGDPDECEDTERIILYDDIFFALFRLRSPELRHQLVLVLLFMLGVPLATLRPKILLTFSLYFVVHESNEKLNCFCHNFMSNDHVHIDSIIFNENSSVNFKVLSTVRDILLQYLSTLRVEQYFKQISRIWFHLESIVLRYEEENNKTTFDKGHWSAMKKFIRSLLKLPANRSCVYLWSMYGLYEYNIGHPADAMKIFSTALQMSHADADDTIFKVAKIIRILIDIEFNWSSFDVQGTISPRTKSNILKLYLAFLDPAKLTEAYDESQPNRIALLKVYNSLKAIYTSLHKSVTNKKDFITCYLFYVCFFLGLTELIRTTDELADLYLESADGGNTPDLTDSFFHVLLLLKSFQCAEAFSAYKRLLEKCINVYPQNQRLNVLYSSMKQFGLSGYKVRRFYDSASKSSEDVTPWLHAIAYEENRMKYTTSQPSIDAEVHVEIVAANNGFCNRIRSLYSELLRDERFKYCSDVWLRFLQFQLTHGTEKQAADTMYLGLNNCPSFKKLYIFICEKFPRMFDEMMNLLEEKEIRTKLLFEELDILMED